MKRTKIQKVRIEPEKQAYKYFLMGLNSHEIGLLIGKSYRTVQGYYLAGKWDNAAKSNQLKKKAYDLHEAGQNLNDISRLVGVCRSTAYLWIKQAKTLLYHCNCSPDITTGWITIKHCNMCGKPIKGEI